MKAFLKRKEGFTLVELLVVMTILAVLTAIVIPAVTGTKDVSEVTGLKGDVQAVSSAVTKFNNDSMEATYPEKAWTVPAVSAVNATFLDSAGASLTLSGSTHTEIDWVATTKVRMTDGSIVDLSFVPDFLNKKPMAITAQYIWLLKKGTTSGIDRPTRVVEVFRITKTANVYERVR